VKENHATSFDVLVRDKRDQDVTAKVDVTLNYSNGQESVAEVSELSPGNYNLQYTAQHAGTILTVTRYLKLGDLKISVTVNGHEVQGSPFSTTVGATINPSHTFAEGIST
jgi:hypothetical protein